MDSCLGFWTVQYLVTTFSLSIMDSVKNHGQRKEPWTESSTTDRVKRNQSSPQWHCVSAPWTVSNLTPSRCVFPVRTTDRAKPSLLYFVGGNCFRTMDSYIVVFRSGFSASAPGTGLFCTFSRMRQFLKLLFLHILQYLDHPHCNQPPPAHIPSRSNPSCSLISHKKGNMQCIKALTQTGACVAAGCCRDADSLHL